MFAADTPQSETAHVSGLEDQVRAVRKRSHHHIPKALLAFIIFLLAATAAMAALYFAYKTFIEPQQTPVDVPAASEPATTDLSASTEPATTAPPATSEPATTAAPVTHAAYNSVLTEFKNAQARGWTMQDTTIQSLLNAEFVINAHATSNSQLLSSDFSSGTVCYGYGDLNGDGADELVMAVRGADGRYKLMGIFTQSGDTVTEPVTFEPTRGTLELVALSPDNTHGAALVVTSSREGPGQFVIEASRIENGKLVPDTYLKSDNKKYYKGTTETDATPTTESTYMSLTDAWDKSDGYSWLKMTPLSDYQASGTN